MYFPNINRRRRYSLAPGLLYRGDNAGKTFNQHDDRDDNGRERDGYTKHENISSEPSTNYPRFKKNLVQNAWNEDVQIREIKDRHQQYYENIRRNQRRECFRDPTSRKFPHGRNVTGWHKIIIKNASNFDRDEVLACIKNHIEEDIIPHVYEAVYNDLVFYMNDRENIARSISKLSGRMTLANGERLKIVCMDSIPPPPIELTQSQMSVIEKTLSERYNQELSRIDLRNFHNDQNLVQEKIFCPLYRSENLKKIIDILVKNIPAVKEIDLSQNQLINSVGLNGLQMLSNLEILNLSQNKIRDEYFSKIANLGIRQLDLGGNPLCKRYKREGSYTSAIKRYFPQLMRLDEYDLPIPINFGVDVTTAYFPPTKPSFFFSDEVKSIVLQFIEQYYQVFESENRRALEAAYTVDACFSFNTNVQEASVTKESFSLLAESRNLLKEAKEETRLKQLFRGHKNIIDLLCKFPKHLHDPNSFIIDVPFVQTQIMHVVLTGVFRYQANYNYRVRSFIRSLIIVPVGAGFCISNEELFFCHATPEQTRRAFQSPGQASTPSSRSSPSEIEILSGEPQLVEMIKKFSLSSKMTPELQ